MAWSVLLSFVIVAVVAVVFYEPDPPRKAPAAVAGAEEYADGPPGVTAAGGSTAPGAEPPDPGTGRQLEVEASQEDRPSTRRARPRPSESSPAPAPAPAPARPEFAVVAEGEDLADVAGRVYGSERAAEDLWRANRDSLPRVDSPLRPGMLLRTP